MNRQPLALQLEMLRLRGELERTQMVEALVELRTSTRRLGAVAAAVGSLRGARGGWLGAALDLVGAKAKWVPLALLALRSVRRHPVAATVIAGAAMAVAGVAAGHRRARTDQQSQNR